MAKRSWRISMITSKELVKKLDEYDEDNPYNTYKPVKDRTLEMSQLLNEAMNMVNDDKKKKKIPLFAVFLLLFLITLFAVGVVWILKMWEV